MIRSAVHTVRQVSETKLYRPQLADDVIIRPRLLALLERNARLSLVVAPAGYGKTTLLSSWLENREKAVAWLTLDAELNDPFLFLAYVVAAVRRLYPGFAQELWEQVELYTHLPLEVAIDMLFSALDALDADLTLVLDDYHSIRNPEVHAAVADILALLPPCLHLVIATRRDPPLPLARLRAYISVVEIRSNDLGFTGSETRQLMACARGGALNEHEIDDLVRGTEGWVVSLQLARLYFRQEQGFASLSQALEMGAQQAMNFLSEEVFSHLPDEMQEFLMQTAILERLCAPACAAVSDGAISTGEALASLRWLAANGIFTTATDEPQECFRYHALFRQHALQQLQRRHSPEQIATLHRLAGKWSAGEGHTADAIRHMLEADDESGALTVFSNARPAVMSIDGWPQLGQLLRLFPQHMVEEHLELLIAQAWVAHSQYDKAKAHAVVMSALALLAHRQAQVRTASILPDVTLAGLEGELEVLQAYLCFWRSDAEGALSHGERGLVLVPKRLWAVHLLALMFLGAAYIARGQSARAYELFDAGFEMAEAAGITAQLRLLSARTFLPYITGDFAAVSELVNRSVTLDRYAQPHEPTTLIYYFNAITLYYRNELESVEGALAELIARPYQSAPHLHLHVMAIRALTFQAQSRPIDANRVAASALDFAEKVGREEVIWLARGLQGEIGVRQARLDDAAFWLQGWESIPLAPLPFFFSSHLALARLYVTQGTPESLVLAGDLLDRMEQFWESSHYITLLIQTLALRVQYWLNQGERTEALATLTRAILLAEPGGFVRTFVDLGPAVCSLLDELQQRGVAPLFVAAIRGAIVPIAPAPAPAPTIRDITVLLTFREQDVLRLIGEHRSNQEIAAALNVSVDTVKRHNNSIFRKLQVNNRRAAAMYARRLPT